MRNKFRLEWKIFFLSVNKKSLLWGEGLKGLEKNDPWVLLQRDAVGALIYAMSTNLYSVKLRAIPHDFLLKYLLELRSSKTKAFLNFSKFVSPFTLLMRIVGLLWSMWARMTRPALGLLYQIQEPEADKDLEETLSKKHSWAKNAEITDELVDTIIGSLSATYN